MKKVFEVTIPVALPTWNNILSINRWKRKDVRDYIHTIVNLTLKHGLKWPRVVAHQGRFYEKTSFINDYYSLIRRKKKK